MRALVQRASSGSVSIGGTLHEAIGRGIVILLGITHSDSPEGAAALAKRCIDLRIFEDEEGKMNLSVKDIAGEILVVSQFTLYGDSRKGNRPSFVEAARPQVAEPLYESFLTALGEQYVRSRIRSGVFRAMMDVALVNEGPVTIMLESRET